MPQLFEPTAINGMPLANRFVRSATWEGLAGPQGEATEPLAQLMAELVRGGAGLLVSSHAYVVREGQAGPRQLGLWADHLVPGLARVAAAVHAEGGRIVAQLAHAGVQADESLSGRPRVAVSAEVSGRYGPGRELRTAEIQSLAEAFAAAARRAREAGFDGVQIHAAHTYLLSQFLSPFYNRREDAYGGSPEKRAAAVLEVLAAVRAAVGPDCPVLVKLNAADFLEGGLTEDDALAAARLLDEAGVDAIELSGGYVQPGPYRCARPGRLRPEEEGYYRETARKLKPALTCPLILVGGIRSLETAERLVAEGTADYIALCRPLVAEPHLVRRWQQGDRRPSRCVSDNRCYEPILAGQGIACVTLGKEQREGK